MGGVGKTTLSIELFNQKKSKYTRASFLFDVREAYSRGNFPVLQSKLLKDIFCEDRSFLSIKEGLSCLKDRLENDRSLSCLIVLDDIDHVDLLDSLLVQNILNGPGNNLLIITTRDVGVLARAGIDIGYHLKGLDREDGRELFCWHAFRQPRPSSGYEDLVQGFINICGGLPLSLEVLGRHVSGRPQFYWQCELEKARKTLPGDIKRRLKRSFDSLDDEEKVVFMDIACFFIDKSITTAMAIWKESGCSCQYAVETLREKCLIEENVSYLPFLEWEVKWKSRQDEFAFRMHDHLRDSGRELADKLSFPHRVWRPQDLKSLELKGFQNTLTQTKVRCFHSFLDESMHCQITFFIREPEYSDSSEASLLWLQLDYLNRPQLDVISDINPSIPSWIPLRNLQCLRISGGRFHRLWKSDLQVPLQLKELQISETLLDEVPDLGILNNLENVALDVEYMPIKDWSLLESLRMNISKLYWNSSTLEGNLATANSEERTPYRSLIIRNFQPSTQVALNKFPMSGLEYLEIGNQKSVTKTLISGCTSLKTLKIYTMENLIEIELYKVITLNCLEVNHCENLKILTFSECPELQDLFLTHLSCLEIIRVGNCEQLESVSGLSYVRNLVMFNISQCNELKELNLVQLSSLERIRIENCKNLKRVSGVSDLAKLVELNILHCPEFESKLCFPSLYCLERIAVNGCRKLKCLELIDCKKVKIISGIDDLEELALLNIRNCPELLQLSVQNLCCRERITIDRCGKLNCNALFSLLNLKIVTFDIGRAVVGAESNLSQSLFSEADVGADAVTEIDIPCLAIDQSLVSKIIICGLVVVERSTPSQYSLQHTVYRSQEFHLWKGRWIVTMVLADPKRNTSFISAAVERMCYGVLEKGFRVTLTKDQEWKIGNVLQTIDDQLYQKYEACAV